MQTVRYAKGRLVRFDAIRVYSYAWYGQRAVRRAGIFGKGTK